MSKSETFGDCGLLEGIFASLFGALNSYVCYWQTRRVSKSSVMSIAIRIAPEGHSTNG